MATRAEYLDTDRDLVCRFQAGDESAFVDLVTVHYSSLLSQARRRLRAQSDAEDAVQEALLRAYRALPTFGGEFHFRAWLGRILANVCHDIGNGRSAERRLEDRLAHRREVVEAADDTLADEGVLQAVREALEALPDTYRHAFVLREMEDRPYAEVARAMDISEVNARARVHRARTALQRSLRAVAGTLSAILAPLPYTRRLVDVLSGRVSASSGRLDALRTGGGGTPSGGAGWLSTLSPANLPGAGQLATVTQVAQQVAGSPALQNAVSALPDVSRTALPAVGALATLAAASIAVVVPIGNNSTSAPASVPDHVQAVVAGPAAQPAGPSVPTESSTTTTAPSADSGTSQTQAPSSSWQWVHGASTAAPAGKAAGGGTDTGSTSSSGGSASTTSSSGPDQTTAAAPVAPTLAPCPWEASFPYQMPAGDPEAPTVMTGASSFISSATVGLSTPGQVFSAAGPATLSNSAGTAPLQVTFATCMPGATAPYLVANVSLPSSGQEWQLRGALISTTATGTAADGGNETDAFFRGLMAPIGADPASGIPFVSEVAVQEPSNIAMLRIALFGSMPGLTDQTASGPTAAGSAPQARPSPGQGAAPGPSNSASDEPAGTTPAGDAATTTTSSSAGG